MATIASARDKFKFKNTMVCLLKAMEGVQTTVELRNENSVKGLIVFVDSRMHITMENVVFSPSKGKKQHFSDFFVQGPQIRFVHIPDHIDIKQAMHKQLNADKALYPELQRARELKMKMKERSEKKFRKLSQTN